MGGEVEGEGAGGGDPYDELYGETAQKGYLLLTWGGDFTHWGIWKGREVSHLVISKGLYLKYFEQMHLMAVSFHLFAKYIKMTR